MSALDDTLARLASLLADPHPGLATWCAAVAQLVDEAGITRAVVLAERKACVDIAETMERVARATGNSGGVVVAQGIRIAIEARE